MNKIHIASRWSRQTSLRQIRDRLHEKTKWRVVSRWIDADRPEDPGKKFFISREGALRLQDGLTDIRKCDVVFLDVLEGMSRRGGMTAEMGYGMGLNKDMILIGDPTQLGIFGNVFDQTFKDWDAAFRLYF